MENHTATHNASLLIILLGPQYLTATILISGLSEPSLVTITLTAQVMFNGRLYRRGDVITHVINPYETIQLEPTTIQFTGSRIETNASVTVVVGSRCANIPVNVYRYMYMHHVYASTTVKYKSLFLNEVPNDNF